MKYFEHQHSQKEGDGNVAHISTLYDRTPGAGGVNTEGSVKRAVGTQMRTYDPPAEELEGRCAIPKCRAYPAKTTNYCFGHARSLGLIDDRGEKKDF